MATEKDFGLERGKEPSAEALRQLVHAPSEEIIRTFGDRFQETTHRSVPPETRPATMGKFVALNNVLLIAPYPGLLLHRDIARGRPDLLRPFDEALRRAALHDESSATTLSGLDNAGLDDAGWFAIQNEGDEEVSGVILFGDSQDFGRADAAGREQTTENFRATLNGIAVDNKES